MNRRRFLVSSEPGEPLYLETDTRAQARAWIDRLLLRRPKSVPGKQALRELENR